MRSRWSEPDAAGFVERYAARWGEDLALRTYSSRLLGAETGLVLHGGGNTSVKTTWIGVLGEALPAIFVKASGYDLAAIEPEGHSGLDLAYLRRLRRLQELSEEQMLTEFRTHLLDFHSATPSIETLAHAFLPHKFVDHTHPDAILALTNQPEPERIITEALGGDVIVLPYVKSGFGLACAVADAFEARAEAVGMVLVRHGLITWGDSARESYERTIELVTRAEAYLQRHARRRFRPEIPTPVAVAEERVRCVAPVLRGLLAQPTGDPDQPYRRVILRALVTRELLDLLDHECGRSLALSPPITSDHLIWTKALPLWVDAPAFDDAKRLRAQLSQAITEYSKSYEAYVVRNAARRNLAIPSFDPFPRVVFLPGLGAVCAGRDALAAAIAADINEHTMAVKAAAAALGKFEGLAEHDLFDMEYDRFQQAKLDRSTGQPLRGEVAIVTGAAGAIGSAIAEELLIQGCCVALADLPGERLDSLLEGLQPTFGLSVMAVAMDVTDADQVTRGFGDVSRNWGGVDIVVANAGIALVASLTDMGLENFRRLERVNIEGTLLVLAEAARHFRVQGTGGDIIVVSTKNVFAPGARFGAYSATKAAAHQIARIASLELAEIGVRVNMVAPDAVFSHGNRRSGLWAEVGPDRMRARGLDEKGLEEYYRTRNLLKAKVTARHVAKAVLYFATHQTPTTGATIPVDGGLPDATPR